MCSYYKKITTFLLLLLCSLSCSKKSKDDTWDIIAVGLPKAITPSIANINMGLYILKQTHEPLLRYKKRTELYSRLLESWDRDLEYKNFNFCLKSNLNFSKGTPYKVNLLAKDITRIGDKLDSNLQLSVDNNCVKLQFDRSQKTFLDMLTKYENAPSHPSENKNWENGLGAFKISALNSKKISLTRKAKVNDGYNKINFWTYSGKDDSVLNLEGIEDYNRVLLQDLPLDKLKTYQRFNVALLQTINLVLNIKDSDLRESLFNCLEISEFRQAFMPEQNSFLDVGTILPIGIPYAKKERVAQKCDPQKSKSKSIFKFYNWNKSSSDSLKTYFRKLKEKTGLNIEVIDITMNQFVEMILKSPHPYDLTVVALDATDVNYNTYFSPIIDSKSVIDIKRGELQSLYKDFKSNKPTEKSVYSITSKISEMHLILPLYQEVRDFYFPKYIKSLTLGKNDLEYLEISELRL